MIRKKDTRVKEQRILLPGKKILGLLWFSTVFLKFAGSCENFGWWKKSLAVEVASCWQTFLNNKQNFAWSEQGLIKKIAALASFGHAFRPQRIQN